MSAYSVSAQYYDAISLLQREEIEAQLASALRGLPKSQGPIVDIGAGTGQTTQLIANTLPGTEIFAVEPDAAMRSALMTRICANRHLRDRVSVLPMGVLEAPLPVKISGAVLSASLTHFSPPERHALWALLKDRLGLSGRVIVEIQCPRAETIDETLIATNRIGRVEYTAFAKAEAKGDHQQRWTIRYQASLDGQVLSLEQAVYDCWAVGPTELIAEVAAFGLQGQQNNDLVEITQSQP